MFSFDMWSNKYSNEKSQIKSTYTCTRDIFELKSPSGISPESLFCPRWLHIGQQNWFMRQLEGEEILITTLCGKMHTSAGH